jgi:diguanylate cyclase (GGDEF)-like protein
MREWVLEALKSQINPGHWNRAVRIFSPGAAFVWTLIVSASLLWNLTEDRRVIEENARVIARTAFQKDVLYRRWNSDHGGVYVPVSASTQPNPYLDGYPYQNITSSEGKIYTLINPAYMTRQAFELQQEATGVIGHITSLKPIRPENAADAWETSALQKFEQGISEVSSVELYREAPYLRLMRPLFVESKCLVCHAKQGYVEGEVRGGISENIPLQPLLQAGRNHRDMLILAHLAIWSIGLAGITLFSTKMSNSIQHRTEAEARLLHLSTHDTLTGLYNRNYFEEVFNRMENNCERPTSILVADMNDLKLINDTYGHTKGDICIKDTADLLRSSARMKDLVFRTGGDEFVLILSEVDSTSAEQFLRRIRGNLAALNEHRDPPLLSIAFGIATADDESPLTNTLKLADQRMYIEKTSLKTAESTRACRP